MPNAFLLAAPAETKAEFSQIAYSIKGGGKMIFVAGQTPSDMEYKCVAPGDFRGQFIAVMENLKKALQASGATFDDVVHRRTYVLDMDKYLAAMRGPSTPL